MKDFANKVFNPGLEIVDYLVISIGDSYASGEGNPDMNGISDDDLSKSLYFGSRSYDCDDPILVKLWSNGKVPMSTDPIWLAPLAHRSEYSGAALAALQRRNLKNQIINAALHLLRLPLQGLKF